MSSSSSGCQVVGYAYFLSFAYAIAEHTTSLFSVYMDGDFVYGRDVVEDGVDQVWLSNLSDEELAEVREQFDIVTTDSTLTFRTGKENDTVPSNSPDGTVHYVQGSEAPMPKLQEWTGKEINYKNLSALVFDDCFIGDGVRTVPQYSTLVANGYYNKVSGNTEDTRANPVDIIYDILKRDLNMSDSLIDVESFKNAAATLQDEKIYVGIVMSSEKKVTDWFDELLKIMDGVLYYHPITGLLSIALLRKDYDQDDVTVLDDTMISKMTVEAKSWEDTYNRFTFKYTDPFQDDVGSVEYANTASRLSLGYDRTTTIQLTSINNLGVLQTVANRMIAKLGIPYLSVKLDVDFIDFPDLHIGAVFKLNSDRLGVYGKIFRVLKITGDAETKSYVTVTASEDFYARDLNFEIVENWGDDYVPPVYDITNPPLLFRAIDSSREFSEEPAMIVMGGKPENTDFVTAINVKCVNGGNCTMRPSILGKLVQDIPVDISTKEEPCPYYSQNYTFVLDAYDDEMYEILGSTSALQTIRHTLIIDNEIMAFKSLINLGDGRFQVEGVIRGLGGTSIEEHQQDSIVYVNGVLEQYTATVRVANSTPIIQASAQNHQGSGPSVTIYPTYNNTIKKPYKPVPYISDGKIVWRPRVARKGATYKNADNITAGEDEGAVTGYYVVQKPDGSEVTITPSSGDILIEYTPDSSGVYNIKHVNSENHYTEGWVSITV